MLQPKTTIPVDCHKAIEALERKKYTLILEFLKCIEFFVECSG